MTQQQPARIKELVFEDHADLSALMTSRLGFLSVAESQLETHRQVSLATAKDLLRVGPDVGRIFGLYEDATDPETTPRIMAAVFTAVSSAHPCYYVNKAYTHPEAPKNALSSLFSSLIQTYEGLGYGRFYTMYRSEDIAVYHKLWRTSSVLKNYISYTDLEVAPNVRPKHSDYWEMMFGRMLYTSTMVIRGFIRKTETMFYNEPAD